MTPNRIPTQTPMRAHVQPPAPDVVPTPPPQLPLPDPNAPPPEVIEPPMPGQDVPIVEPGRPQPMRKALRLTSRRDALRH